MLIHLGGNLPSNVITIQMVSISLITLPKTNVAPENVWLEDEFPLGMAYFQWLLLLVSQRARISAMDLTKPGYEI